MISNIRHLSSRKEEILREAQRLFSKKGYENASMRDLAKGLGIKPASLYSNFDNKEEMLWEIALRCARDFFQALDPIYEEPLPVREKLQAMLEAHIEVVIKNVDASAIFFKEWKSLGEEKRIQYAQLQQDYENKFVQVIEAGMASGTFKSLNPRFAAISLLGSSNWLARWYRPEGKMSAEQIQQELITLLMEGLAS